MDWKILSTDAARAETLGELTTKQLELLYTEKLFNLFVPTAWNGLELSLPEGLMVQEQLAYLDGSVGWTVTLCSGASMFLAYMNPVQAAELMRDPHACFGGSGQYGIARKVANGYIINGQWKYATGAPHCTIFTANCYIQDEYGNPVTENDVPVAYSFYFHKDEVTVLNDWDALGLKATASHSFVVTELLVPANRSFQLIADKDAELPIARVPFFSFAALTLAVNSLGISKRLLDECLTYIESRAEANPVHKTLYAKQLLFQEMKKIITVRTAFYKVVETAWHAALNKKDPEEEIIGTISRKMVQQSRQTATEIVGLSGMEGARPGSVINRVWRDIFTAGQHSLLTFPANKI